MNQNDIHTGIEFARAVAAHFKLPTTTSAEMQVRCEPNGILAVSVSIPLAAEDLAGIGGAMNAKAHADRDAKLAEFLGATDTASSDVATSQVASLAMVHGDALVLTVPYALSREQAAAIKQRISTELAADVRILIIDAGTSLSVLSGLAAASDGAIGHGWRLVSPR